MMKLKILYLSFSIVIASASLNAEPILFGKEDSLHIVVNNRILAKVNDKALSVVDVMKKMDVLFYREFPEYTSSLQARYQFYKANWKHVLDELISKELVIADAEENKLPVSNGDIRQEMETLFGPNIITNLDKIGLSYDDAQKIVQGDITIRRMIYVRVHSKAVKKVTPQTVRSAYEEFSKNPVNSQPDIWNYQVISIRDKDPTRGAEAANLTYELLNTKVPLDQLSSKIKENPLFEKTRVNVSEEYHLEEKNISNAYKEILLKMSPHTYSQPITQKDRVDSSDHLFRLFVLKEIERGGVPSFNDMELKIKAKLLDDAVEQETEAYLKKLRTHFHVEEYDKTHTEKELFEPFSLK